MRFIADEGGTTAIEYGLIAGMIATMMITVLDITGQSIATMVQAVNTALESVSP